MRRETEKRTRSKRKIPAFGIMCIFVCCLSLEILFPALLLFGALELVERKQKIGR